MSPNGTPFPAVLEGPLAALESHFSVFLGPSLVCEEADGRRDPLLGLSGFVAVASTGVVARWPSWTLSGHAEDS